MITIYNFKQIITNMIQILLLINEKNYKQKIQILKIKYNNYRTNYFCFKIKMKSKTNICKNTNKNYKRPYHKLLFENSFGLKSKNQNQNRIRNKMKRLLIKNKKVYILINHNIKSLSNLSKIKTKSQSNFKSKLSVYKKSLIIKKKCLLWKSQDLIIK